MLNARQVNDMPSRKSQGTLGLLRAHKKAQATVSNDLVMGLNLPADIVARIRMYHTTARPMGGLGMPALMVEPDETADAGCALLHLHGGAYTSGGLLQCRAVISPVCAEAKLPALTFSYRLAPRWPYPAQLEDALKAYDCLIAMGYAPDKIAFVGESAGGNLALALALKLKHSGRPLPAALALMSPWTDPLQTGESYRTLMKTDPTLDEEELMRSALAFASGSEEVLKDPMISVKDADFTGFPPTQIHVGTSEILLSDAEALDRKMDADGVQCQLVRWEGMCHVFQIFGFEESRLSYRMIGKFLRERLYENE